MALGSSPACGAQCGVLQQGSSQPHQWEPQVRNGDGGFGTKSFIFVLNDVIRCVDTINPIKPAGICQCAQWVQTQDNKYFSHS